MKTPPISPLPAALSSAVQRIGRGAAGRPASVPAGVGVPGTAPALPGFLAGPSMPTIKARQAADQARQALGTLLTNLGQSLPRIAVHLATIAATEGGIAIAAADGFDLAKAQALTDDLTALLKKHNPAAATAAPVVDVPAEPEAK